MSGLLERRTTAGPPRIPVSSSANAVSICQRCPYACAACGALSCCGSSRSVTKQKSSETSVSASVVTAYSMTRTVIPGISAPDLPSRRRRREVFGSATREVYVPSSSTETTGRSMSARARHSTCAPVANTRVSAPWDRKFRSAATSRPSPSNPVSSAVRVCSPTVMPAQRAPITARDPHSANATTRTCGNAPAPRPPPGRPNAAAFAAVSGTSTVNPSKATSRRPATCAQPSSRPANGPATRSKRSAITCHPSRERALEIAAGDGDIPTATRIRKLFAPPEAPDQLRPHLAVTGLEEHDHRQVVVHHQPGRQHPNPLLTHPGRGHHLIDQTWREDLRQHPHSDLTWQPVLAQPRDLLPNARHPKTIAHGTAKLTPLGLAKSGQKR